MRHPLYILADLAEDEHAVMEMWLRLRVGPSDRAAAKDLLPKLAAAAAAKRTKDEFMLDLLIRLADTMIAVYEQGGDISSPEMSIAMDSLFWFNLVSAMDAVPQPELPDIGSVWVRRPTEEQDGIRVDRCISINRPDQWAIRRGENLVLLKTGAWSFETWANNTDEFYLEQARFATLEDALNFAERILGQKQEDPGL